MKSISILLWLAVLLGLSVHPVFSATAEAPKFLWARADGIGGLRAAGNNLAQDSEGNLFLTGWVAAGSYGPFQVFKGGWFVAKHDSSGYPSWISMPFSTDPQFRPDALAIDLAGNIFVAGTTRDQNGEPSLRLVKLDALGRYVWDRTPRPVIGNWYQCAGLGTDPSGNVFMAGGFYTVIQFGSTVLSGGGGFLFKFDPEGNPLWAQRLGGGSSIYDSATGLAVDSSGHAFVTGNFTGPANFGGVVVPNSRDRNAAFVVKLDTSGKALWARRVGDGSLNEFGLAVAVGPTGSCYLASATYLGSCCPATADYALTKIDANGVIAWTRKTGKFSLGNGETAGPLRLAVDPRGDPLLVGAFIEAISVGTQTFSSTGGLDLILAKYGSNGDLLWARKTGSTSDETISGLVIDGFGQTYLAGVIYGNTAFDAVRLSGGGNYLASLRSETQSEPVLVSINGIPVTRNLPPRTGPVTVELTSAFPNGAIFYTLNGSAPTPSSKLYSGPFLLNRSASLRTLTYSVDFLRSAEAAPLVLPISPGYRLEAVSAGGGDVRVDPAAGAYASNRTVQITAVPDAGWRFLGWRGDIDGQAQSEQLTMNSDRHVEGVFGTTVEVASSSLGEIVADLPLDNLPFGTRLRLTALPSNAAYFAAWGGTERSTTNPLHITITEPLQKVSALFVTLPANRYTFTADSLGCGSVKISPKATHYPLGQEILLTAAPDVDQAFLGWIGLPNPLDNPALITLNASRRVTARFSQKPTLAIEPGRGPLGEGGVRLNIGGIIGDRHTIAASSDYINWLRIGEVTNRWGHAHFFDSVTNDLARRFYHTISE